MSNRENQQKMTPERLARWRKDVLARLDVLRTKARLACQYLEAHGRDELHDKADIVNAWIAIKERFPEDFEPPRMFDLNRHLSFAMPHDFGDIETLDIPAIEDAVNRYGRDGQEFIDHELEKLDNDIEVWELLHPQIRDACLESLQAGRYKDAGRAAMELLMDEIRRRSGRTDDGDSLIRNAVGVSNAIGFSDNGDGNEKNMTEGLKLVLQGLDKGVRNPLSHGHEGFARLETYQILITCSFLLGRMQSNDSD